MHVYLLSGFKCRPFDDVTVTFIVPLLVLYEGLKPPCLSALDPKSSVSSVSSVYANSTNTAINFYLFVVFFDD